jgi:hypothetical protein
MRELEGCSFKHFYGKWIAKFPKSSRKRGKKSTNRRQAHFDRPLREIQTRETGSAFAVYPATLLYCGTLPTNRQTVVLNVAFYCSILPIYMNLY